MLDLTECQARCEWARARLKELQSSVDEFVESRPYDLVVSYVQDSGIMSAAISPRRVPIEISFMAGDVLHNLRSALDHMVWQMTIANGHIPPPFPLPSGTKGPQWRDIQFPICSTEKQFEQASQRNLWGISDRHRDFIREYQPFFGQHLGVPAPEKSVLFCLREFSNIDKHRVPHVAALWLQWMRLESQATKGGQVSVSSVWTTDIPGPIRDDSELFRVEFGQPPHLAPDYSAEVELGVVFHESSGLGKDKLVVPTLGLMGRQVHVLLEELTDSEARGDSI